MNVTSPNRVADSTLPRLVTLVAARKQARWQWRSCADEHQHRWALVIARIDKQIEHVERAIAGLLDMPSFHSKRVIGE